MASTHEDFLRRFTRLYNDRDLDSLMTRYSEDAEMRTLLLGTVRGREAIRVMIRRRWDEVDPRFEVGDI